jgi:hypothetical protein
MLDNLIHRASEQIYAVWLKERASYLLDGELRREIDLGSMVNPAETVRCCEVHCDWLRICMGLDCEEHNGKSDCQFQLHIAPHNRLGTAGRKCSSSGRNQQVNYRVGQWNDSFARRRALSSARRLASQPVAHRFESSNFYRISRDVDGYTVLRWSVGWTIACTPEQ